MKTEIEQTFFDIGDQTALVCVDQPKYQKMIVPQLIDLNYKVHIGLFEEDVLLKLATYTYNVVVVAENFKGGSLSANRILEELGKRSGSLRREHFVVLLSQRCATNDAMSAFTQSVDQIINLNDLANFQPILRRALGQHRELYMPFQEALRVVQAH